MYKTAPWRGNTVDPGDMFPLHSHPFLSSGACGAAMLDGSGACGAAMLDASGACGAALFGPGGACGAAAFFRWQVPSQACCRKRGGGGRLGEK